MAWLALAIIWSGIGVLGLLMVIVWVGLFFWAPASHQASDLKTATSVMITYRVNGGNQIKSIVVDDPAQVKDLLNALEIKRTDPRPVAAAGVKNLNAIDFTLPNGVIAHTTLITPTELQRDESGLVVVTPRFYQKVCEVAARTEGRPIDVLRRDN